MEGNFASKLLNKFHANGNDSNCVNKKINTNRNLEDDLPDGSCFSRVLKIESQPELNNESTIIKCKYVGSFPVLGNDQSDRTEFVKEQLAQMRATGHKKSVLLVISLTGIKVCSLNGKSVLMAHALKRISFATCDPEHRQFSFLAREPNSHFSLQYCHSFLAEDSKTAEDLSGVVGSAFRLAYAQQLQSPAHSETSLTRRESPVAVLISPADILATCRDERLSPKPAARACWAKKLIGKTKHSDPIINQAIELNNQAFSSNISESSDTSESVMNNSRSNRSRPNNLPTDWLASGGGSSSEDNNSPPDVNSYRQVREKPPMSKNLGVIRQENDLSDDSIHGSRSASGSNRDGFRSASGSNIDGSRLSSASNIDGSRLSSASNIDGSRLASASNIDGSRLASASNIDGSRLSSGSNIDGSRLSSGSNIDGSRLSSGGNREGSRSASGGNRDGSRSASGSNREGSRSASSGNRDSSRATSSGNRDGLRAVSSGNRDGSRVNCGGNRDGSRSASAGNRDGSRPVSGGSHSSEGASALRILNNGRSDGFSALRKFALGGRSQPPSAPPTDEESLLESSTGRSSGRSSRSSLDHSLLSSSSSLSEPTTPNARAEASSSGNNQGCQNGSATSSDASVTPPPPPERYDSLSLTPDEELDLRGVAWYQAGISREIALEILQLEPVGAFMVRQSTTKPGCFALSLRVPRSFHQSGIAHYLIMRTKEGGFKIKGFTKEFHTLKALITHHSVMPELLPCPLSKSQFNLLYRKKDTRDLVDMNAEPQYDLLTHFRECITDKA